MKYLAIKHALLVLVFSLWNVAPASALDLDEVAPATDASALHVTPIGPPAEDRTKELEGLALHTTVITRDELIVRGVTNAREALELIPGLSFDQPGGSGGVSSLYVRGGDPNFVLILIDGVRVNDPTNSRGGSVDLTTLNINNVERIEVTKGPLSMVYGSGALSGVVRLITRKGERPTDTTGESAVGDSGEYSVKAEAQGAHAETGISTGLSVTDSGREDDESVARLQNFSSRVGRNLSEDAAISWTLRLGHSDAESFPDDSGGDKFSVVRDLEDRERKEILSAAELTFGDEAEYSGSALIGLTHSDTDTDSPGIAPGLRDPFGIPPVSSDDRYQRIEVTQRNSWRIIPQLRILGGGSFEYETGESDSVVVFGEDSIPLDFEEKRHTSALFGGAEYEIIENLAVSGGARFDFPTALGTQTSPYAGITYLQPDLLTEFRTSWAKAFKLPSFYALGNPIVGNPDLEPEEAEGVEVGIAQPFFDKKLKAGVSWFWNEYKNAIDLEEGPPPLLINRSLVRTQGVEFDTQLYPTSYLSISASVSYVDFDIVELDEELRNRPNWRSGAQCTFLASEKTSLNLTWSYTGDVLDSSIPTGDMELGSWSALNVSVKHRVTGQAELFVAVTNLLDEDYETVLGNPAPGISPRVGLRAWF